ncbi:Cobalamin biosynthesis protein CobD [uncultured Gammaproteobacteria bacterium]
MIPLAPFVMPGSPLVALLALIIALPCGLLTRHAPAPAALLRSLADVLDRRLNRQNRAATDRAFRGLLVAVVVSAAAAGGGWELARLARSLSAGWSIGWPGGWVIEVVVLLGCLSITAPYRHAQAVRAALTSGGLSAGRAAVAALTRRPVSALDDHGVIRAVIEATARDLNRSVVAPVLWYLAAGLPGAVTWLTVAAMSDTIGHRDLNHRHFGQAIARLGTVLNFIPARLTGVLIALTAVFVGGTSPLAAVITMVRDARHHPSLNAGWPEAALAGALSLALSGPYRDGGVTVERKWLGNGRARAVPSDIGRSLAIYVVAVVLVVAGVAGLAILIKPT